RPHRDALRRAPRPPVARGAVGAAVRRPAASPYSALPARLMARPPRYEEPVEYAPVVTDEGVWGDLPPPYVPPEPPHGGAGWTWWLGALLVVLLAVWVSALTLSQLTSREVAIPAVQRGVAALSEVDALLTL